jgi:hypothetical protein
VVLLEVNPHPGYPFYEQASGPISDAIAELLVAALNSREHAWPRVA